MIELSVHFTSDEKDETSRITVRLFRPETGNWTSDVPFEPPLDDKALADLRWYLEAFHEWPTGPDYRRAERVKGQLADWGRALLESVTPDRESARLWQQFCDAASPTGADDGKLVTIDAIEPRVLRLPWELLADEGGHIFSQGIGVRRRLKKMTETRIRPLDLPVRVLVVVSRPDDAGFIDPRAVSRPLLDALEDLGDQVVTEFLYPPTLEALDRRLRSRKAPPVHVVHFDGHGVYDVRKGLGYLLFEDEAHKENPVDADQLGTLLNRCGVPLMVLNACQSAKQEEANPYASVAARLIEAGVGSVLAMSYSVLVVAALKFVEAFYGGLAEGLSVGQAVDEGRRKLLADEGRHTLTRRDLEGKLVEETIRLRDWFLPALYQQAADPKVFEPAAAVPTRQAEALPAALTDPTVPGGVPAEPPHGFHGRAREMLRLERALAEKAVVVLHGFGGLGKTALAAEAGRWFHRTGRFPGGAAFVSFEHGGSLDQLCSWVGQAVSGDPDFMVHGNGPNGGRGDPVERVGALLQERPALVILDNFESVLGREPLMPPEELGAVLDAVWGWVGGTGKAGNREIGESGSRVLITTRDTTFTDTRFKPSRRCAHIELGGLARDEALALAGAVLDDYGIDRAGIDRQALVDLMDRLGGHPLSLNLALPHLRQVSPAELSERFEELLPGFTTGAAQERNESLAVSLEFSLRRLGEETRTALPDLAVFQGGAMEDDLLVITGMDADLWASARAELEAAALITAESLSGVPTPFLRFHPTLAPYLSTQLSDDRRAELEERYWKEYYVTANMLYEADTQTPHQARAVALHELPNLRRALDLALEAATSPRWAGAVPGGAGEGMEGGQAAAAAAAVDFATRIARFLDSFGRWREREVMMARVGELEVSSGEGLSEAKLQLLMRQGETLLQAGRAKESENVWREALERINAEAAYDANHDRGLAYRNIGLAVAAQGRPVQAIGWHRRALEEFEGLSGSSDPAKEMLGKAYTDLGDNLAAVGHFDEAQQAYERGLEISREVGDHRSVGVKLSQLGFLALSRGDLGEAARRYTKALETFRALGEPQTEATMWHQLGRVAEEAAKRGSGDWDEAERCYRESLRLKESFGDLAGVARTCNQLALVAEGAGRPADAERWCLRTVEYAGYLPDQGARVYNNLASLYLAQGRLDEAEGYARRAVEIKETLDLSSQPWTTYSILAKIAEARGRAAEAAQWRRKEQESYAAYAGSSLDVEEWQQEITIIVTACQGDTRAQQTAEQIIAHYQDSEDWGNLMVAFRRVLEGERDPDALSSGLDRTDTVIVRAILAQLSGEAPQTPGVSETPRVSEGPEEGQGLSLGDLLGLVAQATQPGAPPELGQQLHALTHQMSLDRDLPPEFRALGDVLHRILSGEREPDLSGLPPELAEAVRAIL